MRHFHILFAVAGCLLLAGSIDAAMSSAPLSVTTDVVPDCVIVTTNLAFGAYDPLARNSTQELDAAAQVNMVCTRSSRVTVYIDTGRNPVGSTRTLSGSSQRVSYQLFRDAGRTQEWGGGVAGGMQIVSGGLHKPQQVMVYGRIPPGQEVASGRYTDVVMATVDF